MKSIRSQDDILLALEYAQIKKRSLKDGKRLKEIGDLFKSKCAVGLTKCGDSIIDISERKSETVDKVKLVAELGDKSKKFMKTTKYTTLSIKKAA